MVKKVRKEQKQDSSSGSEIDDEIVEDIEKAGLSEDDENASSVDSDIEIVKRENNEQEDLEEKFGLKAINDEEGMLKRLKEIQLNFYSRMESKKLIKKQGKIPFTEHMTISKFIAYFLLA